MSRDEINAKNEYLSNALFDSQDYPTSNDNISLPSSKSSSPFFKYRTTILWRFLTSAAINLLLPFINGLMLGFGELFAHEAAFRLGWGGTKVFPIRRQHSTKPGIKVRHCQTDKKRHDLNELTSVD
ncbi:Mitochondrial import protein 1 [Erysiphe necator]|nr:Mitochondrial import protein 1 [Erysiphe necator]